MLLPGLLLVRWLDVEFVLFRYLLITLLGIVLAEYGSVERVKDWYLRAKLPVRAALLLFTLAMAAAVSVLWLRAGDNLLDLYEALLCMAAVLLSLLTLARIPYVNKAAEFVGRHSMNMFFVHAFIYQNWFYDFTYSLKYPALIYLFLFASSLAASVFIQQLKKWLRVEALTKWISKRLCRLMARQAETV